MPASISSSSQCNAVFHFESLSTVLRIHQSTLLHACCYRDSGFRVAACSTAHMREAAQKVWRLSWLPAITRGNVQAEVDALLCAGHSACTEDRAGRTPLLIAARNGHAHVCSLLLQHGVAEHCHSNAQPTAAQAACANGHANVLQVLLGHSGLRQQCTAQASQLLHDAARHNYTACVQALADAGIELAACNDAGQTALHVAASHGHHETVRLLLQLAPALALLGDNRGGTALHCAATAGSVPSISTLLKHGADVHARDHRGRTALALAHTAQHSQALYALVQHVMELRAVAGEHTSLGNVGRAHITSMAEDCKDSRYHQLTHKLMQASRGLSAALAEAVQHHDADCVALLLLCGADANSAWRRLTMLELCLRDADVPVFTDNDIHRAACSEGFSKSCSTIRDLAAQLVQSEPAWRNPAVPLGQQLQIDAALVVGRRLHARQQAHRACSSGARSMQRATFPQLWAEIMQDVPVRVCCIFLRLRVSNHPGRMRL